MEDLLEEGEQVQFLLFLALKSNMLEAVAVDHQMTRKVMVVLVLEGVEMELAQPALVGQRLA
jgi:hypothetical protein